MNTSRLHGIEKVQVQLATLAAIVVVYALLWPVLRPWDPEGPVTFLANGSVAQAFVFSGCLLAAAAVIALLTVTTRPQGAKLAVLIGAGGMSLRSPPIRSLLLVREGHLASLYGRFILEIVFLSLVLICMSVIVAFVRTLVARVRPGWVWRDPLAKLTDEQRSKAEGYAGEDAAKVGELRGLIPSIVALLRDKADARRAGGKAGRREVVLRGVYCLLLGTLITAVAVLLLLRSADRGQVLFALFVGSLAGFLIAHQVFPSPFSGVAWFGPMLLAGGFYTFAAIGVSGGPDGVGIQVPLYAHALPVDWMTAGAGGGMLGCWISSRIHEARVTGEQEKDKQE